MREAAAATRSGSQEWKVGDQASFEVLIDESLIHRFADLSGDHNPLHVDAEYARKTPFNGPIAHGMLAGALFSRLVGEHLPGTRALYRSQDLRFLEPLSPGTRVCVRGEVTDMDPGLSLLILKTTVAALEGAPIYVEGRAEVLLRPEIEEKRSDSPSEETDRCWRPLERQKGFVIGGSRGIGRAISLELARQGANLAIGFHSDEAAARTLCEEISSCRVRAVPFRLDLANAESVREALRGGTGALGGLDFLVLSGHGRIVQRGVERGEYGEITDALDRSVGALYHAAKVAVPAMKARGGGSIIALSSTVTLESPPPNWTAYTVAKSALVGLVRSLVVELGPYGIRVNLVSPTLTEQQGSGPPLRIREELAARSPLGRLASPGDIARAVAFLASDASSYLTGINLPICGGMVI